VQANRGTRSLHTAPPQQSTDILSIFLFYCIASHRIHRPSPSSLLRRTARTLAHSPRHQARSHPHPPTPHPPHRHVSTRTSFAIHCHQHLHIQPSTYTPLCTHPTCRYSAPLESRPLVRRPFAITSLLLRASAKPPPQPPPESPSATYEIEHMSYCQL
jgi:hypothetical protein